MLFLNFDPIFRNDSQNLETRNRSSYQTSLFSKKWETGNKIQDTRNENIIKKILKNLEIPPQANRKEIDLEFSTNLIYYYVDSSWKDRD